MSTSIYVSIYLSLYLSVSLYVYLSLSLSLSRSLRLPARLPIYSVNLLSGDIPFTRILSFVQTIHWALVGAAVDQISASNWQ